MSIEQEIEVLKNRLNSLIAELNSQKLADVLKLEQPQVTSASSPVDNPNKLPMPTRKDEYEAFLGVALEKYLDKKGGPTFSQQLGGAAVGLGPFTLVKHHGAQAINELSPEFEGGHINHLKGVAANEVKIFLLALNDLFDGDNIQNGGLKEAETMVNYVRNWNLRICRELTNNCYKSPKVREIKTSKENHDEAVEILAKMTPEEKKRHTYKPAATVPPNWGKGTDRFAEDGCELDNDGDHLWDAHKEPYEKPEEFKERHIKLKQEELASLRAKIHEKVEAKESLEVKV